MTRITIACAGFLLAASWAMAEWPGPRGRGDCERLRDGSCVTDDGPPPCQAAPKQGGRDDRPRDKRDLGDRAPGPRGGDRQRLRDGSRGGDCGRCGASCSNCPGRCGVRGDGGRDRGGACAAPRMAGRGSCGSCGSCDGCAGCGRNCRGSCGRCDRCAGCGAMCRGCRADRGGHFGCGRNCRGACAAGCGDCRAGRGCRGFGAGPGWGGGSRGRFMRGDDDGPPPGRRGAACVGPCGAGPWEGAARGPGMGRRDGWGPEPRWQRPAWRARPFYGPPARSWDNRW